MEAVVRESFQTDIPLNPTSLEAVYGDFEKRVRPYTLGNVHPGFMGWVQGGGNVVGMLAEMLAGGLNANLGGRDQAPLEVEKEVVGWMRQLFQFPQDASGVFLTGSSMANFVAILVARNAALRMAPRKNGMLNSGAQLTAYVSSAAHRCISQAMDMAGIGSQWLRKIEVDDHHRIDIPSLTRAIVNDLEKGLHPFCVIGCAGTVDTGSIDDLTALRAIADQHGLWYHIDGAFGALGILAESVAPKLKGIELADSIAFDFHKWAQVPYDAGFLLVRDSSIHLASFENPADYLSRDARALSAASPWPCDLGPDLSRGFRALKTWMTFRAYGTQRIGEMMAQTCKLADYLATRIRNTPELELMAPVELNIVCFRYRSASPNEINASIVAGIQQAGLVIPSSTLLDRNFVIRAAIFNHRTTTLELDLLLDQVLAHARRLTESKALSNSNAPQSPSQAHAA
jgi:aromatic-L-amino-acid/L-tryptophan decarboxylase